MGDPQFMVSGGVVSHHVCDKSARRIPFWLW